MSILPYTHYNVKDGAISALSASLTAGATSLALTSGDGAKFPTSDFCVRVQSETIHVGSRSGDTCSSLTRGYNGTTAASHPTNAVVFQSADASLIQRLYANLDGHTHNKADIADFAHTHPQGDITNLVSDLAGKAASTHSILSSHNGFPGGTSTFLRADGSFAAPTGGADPFIAKLVLASDVSTAANVTPVNVTGLVFTFEANSRYVMELFGVMQSAAATTGYGLQWDVSQAVTLVTMQFVHQLANTGTLSGGSSIADDASAGVSSGVPAATTNLPIYASGVLIAGASGGTAQLRLRSEVSGVTTIKANSILRVMKV